MLGRTPGPQRRSRRSEPLAPRTTAIKGEFALSFGIVRIQKFKATAVTRETPHGVALRLNNEHLKPLAQWAQQVPGLCQRLERTQNELKSANIQLQVYRDNYIELVRDLSKNQITKLENDASEMREIIQSK